MASKRQRDYKAEYARKKEIAKASGFGSVRQYKWTRKTLSLPRTALVSVRSIRKGGVIWSADHSRVPNSRFRMDFTDREAIDYYRAYVIKPVGDTSEKKLDRLHGYLVGHGLITEDEWQANYLLQKVR